MDKYREAHELGPLAPDSSYEAKVSAKNAYGWSEPSKTFQFYTQGQGEREKKKSFKVYIQRWEKLLFSHLQPLINVGREMSGSSEKGGKKHSRTFMTRFINKDRQKKGRKKKVKRKWKFVGAGRGEKHATP